MAKQQGATEKATPRRRREARRKGNIPKSKSFTLFFQLFSFYLFIKFGGEWFVGELIKVQFLYMELTLQNVSWYVVFQQTISQVVAVLVPALLVMIGGVFLDYLVQVRFVFAVEALKPDLKRLNPIDAYFKKVFSRTAWIELLKSTFIFLMLSGIVYVSFRNDVQIFLHAMLLPWSEALIQLVGVFEDILLKVIMGFLVVALADFVYQRWENEESMKMKKEDVKREHKDNEGNPEVKMYQRQKMQDLVRTDIVEKVPKATFIAVNPTHYAVAVRWKPDERNPYVLVKGIDALALFIREVAELNDIPIVHNPPFTRELFQRVEEDGEVPEDMWKLLSRILYELIEAGQLEMPE